METDFFFDVMSPYAWLAAERVDGLLPGVRWRPVLVGAVFAATGRTSWGMGEQRAAGQSEVARRAAERGLPPVRWPDGWPSNSLAAMRAAVWAQRIGGAEAVRAFALAAMRLAFGEGRSLSEPATIAAAATAVGLDGDAALAAAADPEIKAALRAATDAAIVAGVFGVPTVVLGDGTVIWGDDRFERAAAGG